ncbi:MAG: His/Gly/Thr/Pro-type tRNA ligase C-terminal domain-containing protein [Patescibacteria group bacterium]|nr:His/Gly/Thr/Pro-type tRNA ligase C-terminal domain-containing protein [Patescibacteria group bacterium]MCL5261905.1 His/Gly/Thr/Pro-type tRNA ligase C-terminal domain-containing protein [Patescibacteria group bacterium]
MRQSQLFTKTLREAPKDEEAKNASLLTRGGFVYKAMAGAYAFLPLGLRVFRKLEEIIREEMTAIGAEEVLMTSLQPKANWETTGRWIDFDVLFKIKSATSEIEYALAPTHEEEVTPIAKKYLASYRDLPKAVFQIQNKFRDEKRAKAGLLRGREFFMKDLYSFHADSGDLDKYYDKVAKSYTKIFKRVGLGKITYLTWASGGTFSKYSHEFQTVSESGEDTIYVCEKCKVAVNEEIASEQKECPICGGREFTKKKSIEVGNIFKLGVKFSKPFGLRYKDKSGRETEVQMGCYGIGLNRIVGTVADTWNDEKGLIWPEEIAPYTFHLLEFKKGLGAKIYKKMIDDGLEVLYDDRDVSPGEKLADADLIGIPYRLIVSEKTGKKIELKKRSEKKTTLVNYEYLRKI